MKMANYDNNNRISIWKNENLLKKIFEDEGHPFHNILKISEDCNSITTFTGTDRLIYGDKKTCLENLGREIVVQTLMPEDKQFYTEEHYTEEGNRSDLISHVLPNDDQVQNIIEFKNSSKAKDSNTIKNEVKGAFKQIEDKYIPDENGDMFASVVIIDTEEIVKNPMNLEQFLTASTAKKEKLKSGLFKAYGIYIETRMYSSVTKGFSDQASYDLPRSCIIEVGRKVNEFGVESCEARLSDLIDFPTASGAFGIKNVRNVKDPEDSVHKRELLMDILKTALESFNVGNKENITKNGKEKDFVYVSEETILKKIEHGERTKYSITTLNGAVVDGQNSIDCYKHILTVAGKMLEHKEVEGVDEMIATRIKEELSNVNAHTIDKFIEFLRDVPVTVKMTVAKDVEEARQIAINKNNTMQVTPNELAVSKNQLSIQVMSHYLFEKRQCVLDFPKKKNIGIPKSIMVNYSIHAERAAKLWLAYGNCRKKLKNDGDILLNRDESIYILKLILQPEKGQAVKDIQSFGGDFTSPSSDINFEKINEYNTKIQKATAVKKEQEKMRNSLKKAMGEDAEVFQPYIDAEKDINRKREEIEHFNQCMKNLSQENLEMSNETMFLNFFDTIFLMQEIINDSDVFEDKNVSKFINKDSVFSWVYILTLITLNHDFAKAKVNAKDIKQTISDLKESMKWFAENFSAGMTELRNHKDGWLNDVDGIKVTKAEVRNELLMFFSRKKKKTVSKMRTSSSFFEKEMA